MQYELIFLDADETLFDFRKAEGYALAASFDEYCLELSDAVFRDYDEINKALWKRLELGETDQASLKIERFRLLFQKMGSGIDAAAFGASYVGWLSKASFLLEGAEELCAYLAGRYRLAIITNGIKQVQQGRIGGSAIRKYIEATIISEEVGCSKPSPDIFERACEALGFHGKGQIIMVGDSLSSDIQGGINFGIDTCWANLGGAKNETGIKPTYEIGALGELRNIL